MSGLIAEGFRPLTLAVGGKSIVGAAVGGTVVWRRYRTIMDVTDLILPRMPLTDGVTLTRLGGHQWRFTLSNPVKAWTTLMDSTEYVTVANTPVPGKFSFRMFQSTFPSRTRVRNGTGAAVANKRYDAPYTATIEYSRISVRFNVDLATTVALAAGSYDLTCACYLFNQQ